MVLINCKNRDFAGKNDWVQQHQSTVAYNKYGEVTLSAIELELTQEIYFEFFH